MKTTINGVEYTTFEEGKTIKELGIDTTRKFIVCDDYDTKFDLGDIVVLIEDDETTFLNFKRIEDSKRHYMYLSNLAYYDEHKFKVGDRVRIVNKQDNAIGSNTKEYPDLECGKPETYNGVIGTITDVNSIYYSCTISDKYGEYITYCNYKEIELVEDKVIKERDGIKVGDKVEYERGGKKYYGYVAVIKNVGNPYLLRLKGFNEHSSYWFWDEDWYPESEKKDEKNCWWVNKGEFKVAKCDPDHNGAMINESGVCITCGELVMKITTSLGSHPTITSGSQHTLSPSDKLLAHGSYVDIEKQLLTKPSGNKFMSNVIKFAKELVLSKEEKLLRKYCLKNGCGEYTDTAKELVIDKLVKENEAYLIDIAKKMSEEEE